MSSEFEMPKFATESEEADWWFDHREEHDEILAKAIETRRTMTMKQLLEQRGVQGPPVTVQLDFEDMMRAREQANARGISADVYIRDLMHKAIEKNDAA